MNDRLKGMAEYFESRNPVRAAEVWEELGEGIKAGTFYMVAADRHRGKAMSHFSVENRQTEYELYKKAHALYVRAAFQFSLAGQNDQAERMRQSIGACEEHIRELERTGVMREQARAMEEQANAIYEQASAILAAGQAQASATREGFAALCRVMGEGFVATTQALVGGFTALAKAQIASAEIVFRGLERLAVLQNEAFRELGRVVREGDLLQALATYAGLRGMSREETEAAHVLKNTIAEKIKSLDPAEQESIRLNTLKLFDFIARVTQAEEGAIPRNNITRRPLEDGRGPGAWRPVHGSMGNCVLGSAGPPGIVLHKVMEDGTVYQQCTVARLAMTRLWHGVEAFSLTALAQGGCPLPRSRGIIQRYLWFQTCKLADGGEHKLHK